MARWKKVVTRVATRAEGKLDRLKGRLSRRFSREEGEEDPIIILPYRGYGTAQKLFLKGRVLQDEGIAPASEEDSLWRNFVNTYKRFESDEVPGAQVRARFHGTEQVAVTNEEGYFEFWLEPTAPLPTDRLWHEVELELLAPLRPDQPPARTTGYVLVPPPSAQVGIISDVDDTVIHTNATNLLRMGRTVFLSNARTRLPFEGVAAFYAALQDGSQGSAFNPLFYVSSSPWNLYDLLAEFLEIQKIPLGPLMLRDWGISNEEVLPTKHGPHKMKSIRQIMDTFPALPFILIGDSGQEDPEIYRDVVKQFPNRILAIYIRNVSRKPQRPEAILALAREVAEVGSTLILANDTLDAARHASTQGWVGATTLPAIRAQKEVDAAQGANEEPPMVVVEDERDLPAVEALTDADAGKTAEVTTD